MTDREAQEKINDLTLQIKKLKEENRRLKKHNDQLINCIDVYKRFVSGGKQNA